ncbi:MAG: acetate/propionate family kinase [Pseudomonadales bacterium]|nr:acetate/propionate family kinase [Pseudomonadales bacterium]
MNILVVNCGSSSVKYQVVSTQTEAVLLEGLIERVGETCSYEEAFQQLLAQADHIELHAVGHRVVHGGEAFKDAALISDDVIQSIEDCVKFAPLHNPANLAGIQATRDALPHLPQVAVFDTAFHGQMPAKAAHYAIDRDIASKEGIRRYGFHGTSHGYVAQKAAEFLDRPLNELRLITLHLGNGCSACAVEYGHSVDTSMGMTPLEGLMMGTRSGDIDPGAIMGLLRSGYSIDDVDNLLNKNSGLKGISGLSNDLREIEKAAVEGNEPARQAIDMFVYRARKYIGAYSAAMGGVDAIILTGGIGENSVTMRQRILQRFDYMGLRFDEHKNGDAKVSHNKPAALVCRDISTVKALVVKTNEELMIAKQTTQIVNQQNSDNNPETLQAKAIPIAVSARHVHLDKATFATLFGPNAELSHYKDLSQPGQFASAEKVNLIGPRNRIDGVRVLGPLRGKNQVEVSRTDEFFLGIDAPVRDSGRTQGSAPITLEGPNGTVDLVEGLICARRHIHMHTDDARRFGVEDGDEVEVAITGGPRDLVFGDVLVRVSPAYRLEMHIDTDEGNAAELSRGVSGELVYTGIDFADAAILTKRAKG